MVLDSYVLEKWAGVGKMGGMRCVSEFSEVGFLLGGGMGG